MPIVPLYGHHDLRARLLGALRAGSLPASVLLHGQRGVGKQRLALWLGQALLCSSDHPPCGECQHCRYTLELGHPDLHWFFPRPRLKDSDVDADEVRDDYAVAIGARAAAGGLYAPSEGTEGIFVYTINALVQRAALSPAMARRKVFVIGDAERMVAQEGLEFAANALLKLLEEPPRDTTIILTSSEPGALLPTIRSRVVSLRVAPLAPSEVEAFANDARVAEALRAAGGKLSLADAASLAGGAPGRLFGGESRAASIAAARRMLDAALAADRGAIMRLAIAQGASKARGSFSDMLDALTALLHTRARQAVERRDERMAVAASRAIASVEAARERAFGNVSPNLIAASLLRDLASTLQ